MPRLSLLALLVFSLGCGPAYDLAITNVTVVDALDGARAGQTVLVNADTIAAVVPAGTTPRSRFTINGEGKYLIPGLWDMHVHLTYDEADGAEMARLFLDYGVTSVRDTGGLLDEVVPVVQALRLSSTPAPRIYFGGPLLDGTDVVYDGENRPEIGVSTPDVASAARRVQEIADAGASFIKIYEMVSPEVFQALVDAAGELGLPIASHVPLSMLASEAGPHVGSMEHLRNVEMDCAANWADLLAERRRLLANPDGVPGATLRGSLHGAQRLPAVAAYDEGRCGLVIEALTETIQVPTLRLNSMSLVRPYDREGWGNAVSLRDPEEAEAMRAAAERGRGSTGEPNTTFAQWSLHLTGLMHRGGVPIGAGTDTPIGLAIPGFSLHNELDLLVRAGLSPQDALGAATIQPARFLGLSGEFGGVQQGMRADLVLLADNPLDEINNTRSIRVVISKGRVVRTYPEAE